MTDISRRRRIAGRALVGAAALALPLTASITYAEVPPAPVPPQAPSAPAVAGFAPAAPLAPEAPDAPPAPRAPEAPESDWEADDHRVFVAKTTDSEHGRREIRKEIRKGERLSLSKGKELREKEFDARMAALDARLEGLDKELEHKLKDVPKIDGERLRLIERRAERRAAQAPEVLMSCEGEGATHAITTPDGKRVVRVCERKLAAHAVAGLRRAREQIARNTSMGDAVRAEVLSSLDHEIARLQVDE